MEVLEPLLCVREDCVRNKFIEEGAHAAAKHLAKHRSVQRARRVTTATMQLAACMDEFHLQSVSRQSCVHHQTRINHPAISHRHIQRTAVSLCTVQPAARVVAGNYFIDTCMPALHVQSRLFSCMQTLAATLTNTSCSTIISCTALYVQLTAECRHHFYLPLSTCST